MEQFKKGDVVRCVLPRRDDEPGFTLSDGEICVVTDVDSTNWVELEHKDMWFSGERFELVIPAKDFIGVMRDVA